MKVLPGTLLSLLLILPSAWAEPPAEPVEETVGKELVIIETKSKEESIKDKAIDRLFDLMEKAVDGDGDLSEQDQAEILKDLAEAKADVKEAFEDSHGLRIDVDGDDSIMEMFVGMIAIILIFGGPIIIVAIVLYSSFKKRRLTHETINSYVQAGKDIPTEVLEGLQKQASPKSSLHKGVVLIGIGLGIFICFSLIGSMEAGAFGLIPFFIGLAQLLVWKMEGNNKNGLDS